MLILAWNQKMKAVNINNGYGGKEMYAGIISAHTELPRAAPARVISVNNKYYQEETK
jgi:hypothetical protein